MNTKSFFWLCAGALSGALSGVVAAQVATPLRTPAHASLDVRNSVGPKRRVQPQIPDPGRLQARRAIASRCRFVGALDR